MSNNTYLCQGLFLQLHEVDCIKVKTKDIGKKTSFVAHVETDKKDEFNKNQLKPKPTQTDLELILMIESFDKIPIHNTKTKQNTKFEIKSKTYKIQGIKYKIQPTGCRQWQWDIHGEKYVE